MACSPLSRLDTQKKRSPIAPAPRSVYRYRRILGHRNHREAQTSIRNGPASEIGRRERGTALALYRQPPLEHDPAGDQHARSGYLQPAGQLVLHRPDPARRSHTPRVRGLADVFAVVLHGTALLCRWLLCSRLVRPQGSRPVPTRSRLPARAARGVLHVRPRTGHGILRRAFLELHQAHLNGQRMDQTYSERTVPSRKRSAVVLPGAADFLLRLCRDKKLALKASGGASARHKSRISETEYDHRLCTDPRSRHVPCARASSADHPQHAPGRLSAIYPSVLRRHLCRSQGLFVESEPQSCDALAADAPCELRRVARHPGGGRSAAAKWKSQLRWLALAGRSHLFLGGICVRRDQPDSPSAVSRHVRLSGLCRKVPVRQCLQRVRVSSANRHHGARLLRMVTWYPLEKFVVLWAIAATVTFALSAAVFRRVPLLRAML